MALKSWSGSIVRKTDVVIAKNYLTADEIDVLNRLVTIFLESAELHVKMRKDLTLDFWRASVDKLLLDHGIPLQSHGKVTMEQAQIHARKIYEEFDARRKAFDAAQADAIAGTGSPKREELNKIRQRKADGGENLVVNL